MKYQDLQAVFEAFKQLKVLIIGDVMIDAYIYGEVDRISPEAPVPIVNVLKKENRLGGAANVALNVQALGATPILCSIVGDDQEAEIFKQLLQDQGITSKGIIKSSKRITTIKNRVMSGSQQMMRIDTESVIPLDAIEQNAMLDHIKKLIDEVDLVIFEDYDKGSLNDRVIKESIVYANDKGIPTAVDPKRKNFHSYEGCTLFKPNFREFREGLKIDLNPDDDDAVNKAVLDLQERMRFRKALITMSSKGIFLMENGQSIRLPSHLRRVSDVSGAGDTVISIAGLCEALGLPNKFIAELANLGGGIVCEYLGVVPIEKERLFREASEYHIFELLA